MLPIELGWPVQANTGWGLFGLHLALGLNRQGRKVYIPGADPTGIPATLWPTIQTMLEVGDPNARRIRFDTYGNHSPPFVEIPNRFRVLLAVFEDTAAVRPEVMNRYDLVLAPSQWIHDILASHGVASTIFHQGYDESVFTPAPRRRGNDGKFLIFSGGKLEFRKGQDIVIEAFRRFRETPDGKDAILVTAWQNLWPQTMEGIWASGYVKGVPVMRGQQLDIASWAEMNGIPRSAFIDLGLLSQAELANAIRECDVGLFPNRCEGATNMTLCETLGLGIPCIVGAWTGQKDVNPSNGWLSLMDHTSVSLPCSLYQGMDGWREADPEDVSGHLRMVSKSPGAFRVVGDFAGEFSWPDRTAELHELLSIADG